VAENQFVHTKNDVALTGEWNDSLVGNFLWTNANFAEAISDVMTPCTWSMWQIYLGQVIPVQLPGNYPLAGNIGGRPYLNLSMTASFGRVFGAKPRDTLRRAESMFGRIPDDIEIPTVPISLATVLKTFLPGMFTVRKQMGTYARQAQAFLDIAPGWCADMHRRIETTQDKAALGALWQDAILPYFQHAFWPQRNNSADLPGHCACACSIGSVRLTPTPCSPTCAAQVTWQASARRWDWRRWQVER
jgi:hypothetical protein